MKSQKQLSDEEAEPALETDAAPDDVAGNLHENEPAGLVEDELEIAAKDGARQILVAVAAVGIAAALVVGFKIAYDRRRSSRRYRRMVVDQLEDVRDALMSAASELPERGRDVIHQLRKR